MSTSKAEPKISPENAKKQMDDFLDYYEIESVDLPKAQLDALNAARKKMEVAIAQGRLEFKFEDGIQTIMTLKSGSKITFRELDGRAKAAMGSKAAEDQHGRMYAMLGALSDGESVILELKGKDIGLVECLGAFLSQV